MVSTPAQLLQPSLLFYRITNNMVLGGGVWGGGFGGGGHDKHMRSAAADQPARFFGIQNNMVLGGGGGGGMVSTPAQLLQTSLLFYRITK